MINYDMKNYNFYLYSSRDEYGQERLTDTIQGSVKMSINITNQAAQQNINYSGASYVGLTYQLLDDTYVIEYGDKLLKVLYVNPKGRLKQVFMNEY